MKRFVIFNVPVAVLFFVLWIWQYHMSVESCDRLDKVAPWLWFVGFFVTSLLAFRRRFPRAAVFVSLGSAALCWLAFFILVTVTRPIFDPMY